MAVNPVTPSALPPLPQLDMPTAPRTPTADSQGEASFSNLIRGMLDLANQPHVEANQAVMSLAQGETDNVHNVVMSMVNADMSFRFVLELRNRLTEAYQEVMRMQV